MTDPNHPGGEDTHRLAHKHTLEYRSGFPWRRKVETVDLYVSVNGFVEVSEELFLSMLEQYGFKVVEDD